MQRKSVAYQLENEIVKTMLTMLGLLLSMVSMNASAGLDEGRSAALKGDYATAIREWKPLADKGDPDAQYNMGLLYAYGDGVPLDYVQAATWYRKAADQGVSDAQLNLGVMYYNGKGVPFDKSQARYWLRRAAKGGDQKAADILYRAFGE
jgi:TPR repeat protein